MASAACISAQIHAVSSVQNPHGSATTDDEDGLLSCPMVLLGFWFVKVEVKSVSRSSVGSGLIRLEVES